MKFISSVETLDYTIRIGSTPTFLYFDLYLYSAYLYVYFCRLIKSPDHRSSILEAPAHASRETLAAQATDKRHPRRQ